MQRRSSVFLGRAEEGPRATGRREMATVALSGLVGLLAAPGTDGLPVNAVGERKVRDR
jgi:hypothetical protein